MSKIRAVKKCPTFTKEIITFDKKGRRIVKTVEVSDNYLLIMDNGNSLAVTKKQLADYGVKYEELPTITEKTAEKIEEPIEEVVEDPEIVEEIVTETPSLINGSTN